MKHPGLLVWPIVAGVGLASWHWVTRDRLPGVMSPPEGVQLAPPPVRLGSGLHAPLPTNRFWSSLIAGAQPMPHYPHPLAVHPSERGFRISAPAVAIDNKGFSAVLPPDGATEDLVLSTTAMNEVDDITLESYGDWHVTISLRHKESTLRLTYADGSPYVAGTTTGGQAKVHFADAVTTFAARHSMVGVTVRGRHYGLFAPRGFAWRPSGVDFTLDARAPPYFSVARLPDAEVSTLETFAKHAHARIVGTTASFNVDEAHATVNNTFVVTTEALEGEAETILALYPHQWAHAVEKVDERRTYHTIRGDMRLFTGRRFTTTLRYPGILPTLPPLLAMDKIGAERARSWLDEEHLNASGPPRDVYFEGKLLGRLSTQLSLWPDDLANEVLLPIIKKRLTQRFTPKDEAGHPKPDRLEYDASWGALLIRPEAFGNVTEMNDHHLQYGYYLRAAADLASRDPEWARAHRETVNLLVRDVVTEDRADPLFPFLRCFDAFAGHSWASGFAPYIEGNNLESSSEAMNAWSALILLGEAYQVSAWRKLGIYLYTTELSAIEEYWFDTAHRSFPQPAQTSALSLIFGGKGRLETWFSSEPEALFGINWLPFHGGSAYLGRMPEVAERVYQDLRRRRAAGDWVMWADLIVMYRAFSAPEEALSTLAAMPDNVMVEAGNSRMALHQWVHSLARLGTLDSTVSADVPLALTFKKGEQRTHIVYRMPSAPAFTAHFSDGTIVDAKTPGFHMDLH